jgi:hypothetical protein
MEEKKARPAYFCIVLRWHGGRVKHLHWPRWDILNCMNTVKEDDHKPA